MATPVLAVVGHPNKGKSSLVATLARDESVAIDADPGTTRRARSYPMRVDGELLYTLVDTPGFQRARSVLAWLEARAADIEASAADRPRIVSEFLSAAGHRERFPDESELLEPIVAGAGILYVVDGSVPYGPEYEAEMEVLRWTGRPSMAIINPIHGDAHVASWQNALGQFFRIVRVLDAVRADPETQHRLLKAFGELDAGWREPIDRAVEALDRIRETRRRAAARSVADLIAAALELVVEKRLDLHADPVAEKPDLEAAYQRHLREIESEHWQMLNRIHGHERLEAHADELAVLDRDLFSEGTWLTFGLSRRDLVAAGAAGGAAAGGAVDVALGGASVFLGAAAGAVAGGFLGFFGASKLAEMRVIDRPLGGKLLRYGPSRNPNLPFVLLGRARFYESLLASRTHAMRGDLQLDAEAAARMPLERANRSGLERHFSRLRGRRRAALERAREVDRLSDTIESIFRSDEGAAAL